MRKGLFSVLAALVAFNAFGIGATQEWVKRQLSQFARVGGVTNIAVTAMIPASAFSGGDCVGAAECTIKAEIGSHVALKVVASTVSEIPVGTFYAQDAQGHFQNVRNGFISMIYASSYDVSRTVTNALGVASVKSVRMGNFWAVDSGGKAWRMGIQGGDTVLYCADAPSRIIALRSTTLPERAANVLLTRTVSLFSSPSGVVAGLRSAFSLNAQTLSKIQYTINSEITYTIGQITIVRTDRRGNKREVVFTPDGLECIYEGPNGPFDSKEEAQAAVKDLSNWGFPEPWDKIFNVEKTGAMTPEDFENSDAWKYLMGAIEEKRIEEEIPVPDMPSHPCPAPSDYWVFEKNQWVKNASYDTDEELEAWRGSHGCVCAMPGCSANGVAKHLVGRVRQAGGSLVTSVEDGSDGCKCCVRCVKYGSDPFVTIDEYDEHRANGAGGGFCGCACGKNTPDNENEWDKDYHNWPLRGGGVDYACMCYCSKDKGLGGEYVKHVKYKGDSPWCENICGACHLVEDEVTYINHQWPSFDSKYVKLRDPVWSDHTPRSEAESGVSVLNDPDFYERCGCACGEYDENIAGALPGSFNTFHQLSDGSCSCHCKQVHNKNMRGDNEQDEFPCSKICSVCKKVKDEESDAVLDFYGAQYPKLVMRDPDEEDDHDPDDSECGCKCYNDEDSRASWSIGSGTVDSSTVENGSPKWHMRSDDSCECKCGSIAQTASGAYGVLWQTLHIDWSLESECPKICGYCDKLRELGEESKEDDHEPSEDWCGCACGFVLEQSELEKFHKLRREAPEYTCLCPCGFKHDGKWKMCGDKLKVCTLVSEHTEGEGDHVYAGGSGDAFKHPCKCGNSTADHVWGAWVQYKASPNVLYGKYTCTVSGCAQTKEEQRECKHPEWTEWKAVSSIGVQVTYHRSCKVCTAIDELVRDLAANDECITDIDFHVPNEAGGMCGCKCGYYGTRVSDNEELHKWDASDIVNGVANCLCKCKTKHRFRSGSECPAVCAACQNRRADGSTAQESDHVATRDNRCGCACGYYGVTSEHTSSGRSATSAHLHNQAVTHGNGAPAFCQCYGGDGLGGKFHWRDPRTGCTSICQWTRENEPLGHLAASENPEWLIKKAKASDHTPKAYGCGCACGLCNENNRGNWKHEKSLHKVAQGSTDKCHCACDSKELVGTDEGGHTWEPGKCTCTCGKKHKDMYLNVCDYCSQCGRVWRGDFWLDGTVAFSHKWNLSGCYCDCGMHLHSSGHCYEYDSCECDCGEESIDHILKETKTVISKDICWLCYGAFVTYRVSKVCERCGGSLGADHYYNEGEHKEDCGAEPETPSCWKCGCACTKNSSHSACGGHYCSACCDKKPKKPRKKNNPDIPDDEEVEPNPETPTVKCSHPSTKSVDMNFDKSCDACGAVFSSSGELIICKTCGELIANNANVTGEHQSPCTDSDPGHDDDGMWICSETLSDGSTCGTENPDGEDCSNRHNHKSSQGGGGTSGGGGTGSGGLDDI